MDSQLGVLCGHIDDRSKTSVEPVVKSLSHQSYLESDSHKLLEWAVACLQTFCQANFTGPKLDFEPGFLESDEASVDALTSDGEPAFRLMLYPGLLVHSEKALDHLSTQSWDLQFVAKWWQVRALLVHQSVIHSVSNTLQTKVFDLLQDLQKRLGDLPSLDSTAHLVLKIEYARAQLVFGIDALNALKEAAKISGLDYVLTGVQGKRTKYQVQARSQLVVLAQSKENIGKGKQQESNESENRSVALNSDLLLEQMDLQPAADSQLPDSLQSIDPNHQPALSDFDNALLVDLAQAIKDTSPIDVLVHEKLLAYVNRVIESPAGSVNWSIFSRALWARSELEAGNVKTVERGTLQMQSLVEELGYATKYLRKDDNDNDNVEDRLRYMHLLTPLPKWGLDSALAQRYMAIGALKSAVEVYERLEMWPEVALCYHAVGQTEYGIEVLQAHLDKHPRDARSWSVMGDITITPEYWQRAWDLGKYPEAKRSLGRFYHSPPANKGIDRDLDLSIRHLNDALKINPLHGDAWFLYGVCGLETRQWELAAEAFSRCAALNPDDARSWSNLATALLSLGQKPQAFNALAKAVQASGDSKDWRVWANYATVAADIGDWSEVVRAQSELAAMKKAETAVDFDLLRLVVQVLVEEPLRPGVRQTHLQKSAIDLVTVQIPPLITFDARLWKLAAKVHMWLKQPWTALECYEKAFRIVCKVEPETQSQWDELVEATSELVDAYTNLGPLDGRIEGSVVCKDHKFRARSAVRTVKGKAKVRWEDSEGWTRLESMLKSM